MNLCLDSVLDETALARVREMLTGASWQAGADTAGWNARPVKANRQASHTAAAELIEKALARHRLFQAAALPARMRPPLFSSYGPGMAYGNHVDNAVMGGGSLSTSRVDLAMTLFLSNSADYEGGVLELETHEGTSAYKLEAGQALLYPATMIHRVTEVESGERHAAIIWVQSLVRDAARREILFDLDTVRRRLWEKAMGAPSPEFDLLNKSYSNLLRAWAEP